MDTSLVIRSRQGDEGAFRDLAQEIAPRFLDAAFGILRDRALAEDATQRALLQVWRALPSLREPDRFEAWSYRLLVHACYAESRRRPRWLPELAIGPGQIPVAPDVYGALVDRDELERGFRRLSMDHRAVVVLHHLLELTLDQTAEALGIPVGTVRSRLFHAMRNLRAALEADGRQASRLGALPGEVTR